jgi:hypothetical protein
MYQMVLLEHTSFKTVAGSSGETHISVEAGKISADRQASKFSKSPEILPLNNLFQATQKAYSDPSC